MLTGLKIRYWGDGASPQNYIALTVHLYADDQTTPITATRSAGKGSTTYTFPNGFTELKIKKKLKIVFDNLSGANRGGALVYNMFFTFK